MTLDDAIYTEIRSKLQSIHGVAIGQDDPILMLVTLQQDFIKRMSISQEEMLDQFRSSIQQILLEGQNAAREQSERMLNTSVQKSVDIFDERTQSSASALIKDIEKIAETLSNKREKDHEKKKSFRSIPIPYIIFLLTLGLLIGTALTTYFTN